MDRLDNRTMFTEIDGWSRWINTWKGCNRTVRNFMDIKACIVAQILYLVKSILKYSIKYLKKFEDLTQSFRYKL